MILMIEYLSVIDGARVDDLVYLKDHHIDRNTVSQELSRIFAQMVYLNGCEYMTLSQSLLGGRLRTFLAT